MEVSNNIALSAEEFWHFSLDIYQEPKVQELLLQAQQQLFANVNLSLFCLWLTKQRKIISEQQLLVLDQSVAEFGRDFTVPLRKLRQGFKAQQAMLKNYSKIRKNLLGAELLLEQQEQALLVEKFNQLPAFEQKGESSDPTDNLQVYQVILSKNTGPNWTSGPDLCDLNQYISQC